MDNKLSQYETIIPHIPLPHTVLSYLCILANRKKKAYSSIFGLTHS